MNIKKINLPYPEFLAYNFEDKVYEIKDRVLRKRDDKEKIKKLINNYSEKNVVIVYNGEMVYNNISDSNISSEIDGAYNKYINSDSKNIIEYINKTNNKSYLNLITNKNTIKEIFIVFSGNKDFVNFSSINISDNSEVKITIIYEFCKSVKINNFSEVKLNKNSKLEIVELQDIKNSKDNVFNIKADVFDNSFFDYNLININSTNMVNIVDISLSGEYAEGCSNTINFANKNYSLANSVTIKHLAKNTTSNIENYGIVNDFGQFVVDGIGVIENGFSKSVAEQESRIINLTDTARSVANPQLIINEYDVKAGHAAAVGRVDEDQLYYLMSRGLTKKESIKLLIMSNIDFVLKKINDKKILNKIIKGILNKIS